MSDTPPPSTVARPSLKATRRLGQRQLNLISNAVVGVIVVMLVMSGYRIYKDFKSTRDLTISKGNLIALYKAFAAYAEDWDGRFPPADHWTDAVMAYLHAPPNTPGGVMSYMKAPADEGEVGYVYNDLAAGYNISPVREDDRQKTLSPNHLVILIEKHGAQPNEHILIPDQGEAMNEQKLFANLDFAHFIEDPQKGATVMLLGSGRPAQRERRDFQTSH